MGVIQSVTFCAQPLSAGGAVSRYWKDATYGAVFCKAIGNQRNGMETIKVDTHNKRYPLKAKPGLINKMSLPVCLEGTREERARAWLNGDLGWGGVDSDEGGCFSHGFSLGEKATASVLISSSSCTDNYMNNVFKWPAKKPRNLKETLSSKCGKMFLKEVS